MKKFLMVLGLLVLVGGGCSSSSDVSDDTAPVDSDSATLSSEVLQIQSDMEIMQVAASTDNCAGLLIHFAPGVATDADCADIAAFMISRQAFNQIDWPSVSPNGSSAVLYDATGKLLSNMVYDDSGLMWGYKLSDRFWE